MLITNVEGGYFHVVRLDIAFRFLLCELTQQNPKMRKTVFAFTKHFIILKPIYLHSILMRSALLSSFYTQGH